MDCEMVMDQKANMDNHIRSCHTGEKPYICDAPGCGNAFATRGSLTRHQQRRKHTRTTGVVSSGPAALPQQLIAPAEAGVPLEDIDTVPSSPQSDSEAGSPEWSTRSQSQSSNSDLQGMLSSSSTPSPHASDLYLPEIATPSASYTNLLFVDTIGNIVDPMIVDGIFPTSPPVPHPSSPFFSTSPVKTGDEQLSPLSNFNSLNASFRSLGNESYKGPDWSDSDITERIDLGSLSSFSSSKNERLSPALSFDSDRSSSSHFSPLPFSQLLMPLLFETEQFTPQTSAFDQTFLGSAESLDAFQLPIF
ncbi:hypothetical protein IW262DRAFT_348982 [Armillaria fumosa]|nr:hypothetical protein IW262DRAFT_348982 [Armillaria fumosa]